MFNLTILTSIVLMSIIQLINILHIQCKIEIQTSALFILRGEFGVTIDLLKKKISILIIELN
jgi:hypothetical protein